MPFKIVIFSPAKLALIAFVAIIHLSVLTPCIASARDVVTATSAVPVVINVTTSNEFSPKDWINFGGVLATFLALLYSINNNKNIRRQSINDDFWLRKILGPVSLEPLIQGLLDISSSLPPDRYSPSCNTDALLNFMKDTQPKIFKLSSNLDALGLLDKNISQKVRPYMVTIEDAILTYCAGNANKINEVCGSEVTSRSQMQNIILEALLGILNSVKEYQKRGI